MSSDIHVAIYAWGLLCRLLHVGSSGGSKNFENGTCLDLPLGKNKGRLHIKYDKGRLYYTIAWFLSWIVLPSKSKCGLELAIAS